MTSNFLDVLVDPSHARLDIIAIHGLNPFKTESNAKSTFTWVSNDGREKYNWLSDESFLPTKIPEARILLFGYNSNAVFGSSNAGLNEQAKNLLVRLRQERRGHENRPLIFVCHSLGGLLAKRAIVIAHNNNIDEPTYKATYGFVFFAVPHGGGHRANFGAFITGVARTICNQPSNSFLEALTKNDFFSAQNQDDFLQREKDFAFLSFYETQRTSGHMVVKLEDATLRLSDEREDKIGVDADHSKICKFEDPNGREFRPVWQGIRAMAEKAMQRPAQQDGWPSEAPEPDRIIFGLTTIDNRAFKGRKDYIQQLYETLNVDTGVQNRVILHGLSGVGKSAIATQYALAFQQEYNGVFWISLETRDSMESGYRDLDQLIQRRFSMNFADWCSRDSKRRWLLVIDNVDDPKILMDERALKLSQKLPPSSQSHVIITSTRKDLSDYGDLIHVEPLRNQEAIDLLLYRSAGRSITSRDSDDALSIVRMLGYLPLAIEQCGAFISAENSSLGTYSTSFETIATALDDPMGDTDEDSFDIRTSRKSILTTWEISYSRLREICPDAAALLAILGFLDSQKVSESLLIDGFRQRRRWQEDGRLADSFLDQTPQFVTELSSRRRGRGLHFALQKLVTYSLLFRSIDSGVEYSMHAMTRHWLRQRERKKCPEYRTEAIFMLANSYPDPELDRHYGLASITVGKNTTLKAHTNRILSESHREEFSPTETIALYHIILCSIELDRDYGDDLLWMSWRITPESWFSHLEYFVAQLGCSPHLWMRAATACFDRFHSKCRVEGNDLFFNLRNISFAGVSWRSIIEKAHRLSSSELYTFPVSSTETSIPSKQNFQHLKPDKSTKLFLMPVACIDAMNASFNGWIGKFVIRLVEKWRSEFGRSIKMRKPRLDFIQVEMRTGRDLLLDWISHPSLGDSDFETLISSHMQLFLRDIDHAELIKIADRLNEEPRNPQFPIEYGLAWIQYIKHVSNAARNIWRILGTSNTSGSTAILRLIWEMHWMGQNRDASQLAQTLLEQDIGETNFYALIKTIDAIQFCLEATGSRDTIEKVLLDWLHKFEDVEESARVNWNYANDPILDMLEFLIVFYRDAVSSKDKAEGFKALYLQRCVERYRDVAYTLCLGCDVGAYGMSFARIRILLIDGNNRVVSNIGRQLADSDLELLRALEIALRHERERIKQQSESRADERDGCHAMYKEHLSILKGSEVPIPLTTLEHSSIGGRSRFVMNLEDDLAGRPRRSKPPAVSGVLPASARELLAKIEQLSKPETSTDAGLLSPSEGGDKTETSKAPT